MNEFEALELLAKHYYCPHPATLISDHIYTEYNDKKGNVSERVLTFECEHCNARWSVVFEVED